MSGEPGFPNVSNLAFVESLYERYLNDPSSVNATWRRYFDGFAEADPGAHPRSLGPSFRPRSVFNPGGNGTGTVSGGRRTGVDPARVAELQDRVDQLIRAYRVRGHLIANYDPLGLPRRPHTELEPGYYGLEERHMGLRFSIWTISGEPLMMPLRDIIEHLRSTYCRSIGVQFMHIDDITKKNWLQHRMEGTQNRRSLTRDQQRRILTTLTDAVIFEEFIQKKYLGAKRFSLEGAESLIPLLDMAINRAGEQGVREIVFGMAHRGRLNVLANILGKSPRQIFYEFEDADPTIHLGGGDVKYHLGYSNDHKTSSGNVVHLSLCFNPSHLEFVNPVVLGRVRAKQDRIDDRDGKKIMGVLIHGDAAFAGQGVTQETLNLSELEGYRTGGTLHIVLNNQIGFTTSPKEGRSSLYATGVAKMLQIPIFIVNGEDPEAVAQVVAVAMDFRDTFERDVVIDMYCYRKYGHNEGDEPAFTNPIMYEAISKRASVRDGYFEHLEQLGDITREEADEIAVKRRELLEKELSAARSKEFEFKHDWLTGVWTGYHGGPEREVPDMDTGIGEASVRKLIRKITEVPANFQPHKKIIRLLDQRREMAEDERPIDWGTAEAVAFASLATEGHRIRVSGQDSARGTFSHRHSVLLDIRTGEPNYPLQHVALDQAPVDIWNSPLSEIAVMGFEYGYSLDYPEAFVGWEAQFGDFFNVAQVVIDQFIISAEDKWRRLSGLVLLLPHGFEGQGPEHSSARLERFLMLAAEDNMQIVNATTPAQYFHVLRRQVVRKWRKPLIIMTPKSLLRSPKATSTVTDLAEGRFRRILRDQHVDPKKVERILLCSGKIYYDLAEAREERGRDDVAIVRFEQLYPLRDERIEAALGVYEKGTPAIWVQEEPENSGAWRYFAVRFGAKVLDRFPFWGIFREESASPATGSSASHTYEQKQLIDRAFSE